ncbi:MAG: phosphoadenylyl-sulfate reductase [Rhodanobacter sp.]
MRPLPVDTAPDAQSLAGINAMLATRSADQRVAWALEHLPGEHVLSSSFGAQAAVSLHLVSRRHPDIPVILIDTGYLFPETYRFVDQLTQRLGLNLKVYQSPLSPAWMEARHGQLWRQGVAGIDQYNRVRKIEPMQRALDELHAGSWIAGLRRQQSRSRAAIDFLEFRHGRWKLHPLADWSDRDVGHYLSRHGLPYHPLWEQGYVSIGDHHTSRRWEPGMDPEDTRFFGLKRECGLHGIA